MNTTIRHLFRFDQKNDNENANSSNLNHEKCSKITQNSSIKNKYKWLRISNDITNEIHSPNQLRENNNLVQDQILGFIKETSNPTHYSCKRCTYKSTKNSSMKIFVKSLHLGIKDFKCTGCSVAFTHKNTLNQHRKTIQFIIKDIHCIQCEKAVSSLSGLQDHKKSVHSKIKDFHCNNYEKGFSKRSKVYNHRKMVHLKIKDFQCTACESAFFQKPICIDTKRAFI